MGINKVKRDLQIDANDIAEAFGYKDGHSFNRSSRKLKVEKGIETIYNLTKNKYKK